ncbi:hypothetical protein LCGC14_2971600 [marine sediment metagenome]|uniref:Uncharacterized protein n=1 Tax=marine sediment metagenome TaxID=412755 RepID=A0A0F8X976_9ZZZZ
MGNLKGTGVKSFNVFPKPANANYRPFAGGDKVYYEKFVKPHLTHEWQWLADLIKNGMPQTGRNALKRAHGLGLIDWRLHTRVNKKGRSWNEKLQHQYRLKPVADEVGGKS